MVELLTYQKWIRGRVREQSLGVLGSRNYLLL